MKFNKILLVSIILLAILTLGAASAADNAAVDDLAVAQDSGDLEISSPLDDEIITDGDIATDDVAVGENVTKLKSSNQEVLSEDNAVITQDTFYNYFDENGKLLDSVTADELILRGEFSDLTNLVFDRAVDVTGDGAVLNDMGIIISANDVTLKDLTLIATDVESDDNGGALIYVTGENDVLDGLTIDYAPGDSYDAYAIYMDGAKNFQLLNCDVNFTGSSLADNYEYAMKIIDSQEGIVEGNVIRANLPILDVDYTKGDPGLDTDLVLNTGIKDSSGIDLINNTFIAKVIGRNGGFPTLDCVMIESCEDMNIIGNTLNETDFVTEVGQTNYLNVLDMYYSNSTLVQGNKISVETEGGAEDAGTSYPIQLTGPYEDVVIDGNDLYSNCAGPALGIYSQNYFGATEITVQNNNIDVTGLPTKKDWGLVSGIELQDNVARVYNNTIKTKSITGTYVEGDNVYGISYAQSLRDDHCYDIQNNTVETEGKYTIYILKAQDTTITGNSLVSSLLEGDDSVYIVDASGNTIIENNTGINPSDNIVTPENFFSFFDEEGFLLDSVTFDELIFQGDFSNLVERIYLDRPITITGDGAVLNDMGIDILSSEVALNDLTFIANSALGSLIYAFDADEISLTNLNIFYEAPEGEEAIAIDLYQVHSAEILDNIIYFESHVASDELKGIAIQLVDTEDVVVDNNEITTKLPCVYVNHYDEDYYMMGSNNVNPVRLKNCNNLMFTNNMINSTTNNYSAQFPTIQSIYIIGCSNSLVDNNVILMIDEMTPAGMDNYLYGIDFGYNNNVTFSNNFFNMSTKGGKDAAGTAYAFQGVESEVIIKGNNITSISNGPNLGIYVASMFGDTSELLIEDNFINVTGSASDSGTWALVSGIEIQNGNAQIYNNTIYTYNVNDYADTNYMYGISYAQWMYGDRSFDIENNTVYTEGKYTISVIDADYLIATGNTLYAHDLVGDASINPGSCADVEIGENFPPSLTNIVTNDTFYSYFDESGFLLDTIDFDELIFQGAFSDLAAGYVIINKPITIIGEDAVLNNLGIMVDSEDVTLDNLTLVATSSLGDLINVGASNVELVNLDISYVLDDDTGNAINVQADKAISDVNILNNNIYFESHTTSDEELTTAINLNNVTDVIVDGNTITANIPSLTVETYDYDYFMMGLCYVNPVRLYKAHSTEVTNNKIDVIVNSYDSSFPTVQALYIVGSDDVLIQGNNITMVDTLTPAGTAIYLYAVECGFSEGIGFIENNFNISTTGGKSGSGSAYALQVATADAVFIGNNITCESNGPNLGIYAPYGFGPAKEMVIEDNFLNITGYATGSNEFALISAIEIQTGYATIYNNTVYVQNKGGYDDNYPVSGISAVQYSASTLTFDIQDNEVYVPDGKYAVEMRYAPSEAIVTGNYLIAHELYGDDAVSVKGDHNTVENNLPKDELTNVVTNDTFFDYFDASGVLKDSIAFDELIFNGTFSDLVDVITFNRAIDVIGENAVLNNIAVRLASDDVTLSEFTLNADKEFADNNGALIYATGSDIEISDVVVNYTAPSEVEAIAVYANAANNFELSNSEIIFVSTNPGSKHNYGLEVRGSENVLIENNIIDATLPSVDVSWSGSGIGTDLVLAVGIQTGKDITFTENTVTVNTNGGVGSYPTIDAVMVNGVDNLLVVSNDITLFDTTTSDTARYYYALDIYSSNATVEGNNIIVNTTSGIDRTGTAYPIQLTGPFTVTVSNNNLTAVSKGPTCGIYASNWGGYGDLTVEDNTIDILGSATAGGYALLAAIEAEIDVTRVYNNTINVANFASYDDTNPVYGVSMTSQYMGDAVVADIKDNDMTVDGKYAVYYVKAANSNVIGNTLYAHELSGDDAAVIASGNNNVIKDNLPKELTNIVTKDNFFDFFDEEGNLLDSVAFDELILQGDFTSDLVSYICIDRPLTITGDNAVLNDIGFIIAGNDITLDAMTLVANSDLGNLIDIAAENAIISNMNITYVVSDAANAINLDSGANGVQILNNNIYFESTVDEYTADDVTNAICVNSGISIFDDDKDPITDLVISGNNITAVIPAFLADIYEHEYYLVGLSAVNGIRINGAEDFEFTNNNLDVTTNHLDTTTPTFQAMYVAKSSGLIDGNNISMIDTFTPANKDVYIYAMEIIYDEDLTISNNNFNLSTTGGNDNAGAAYAIQAIASDFEVIANNITTVSNGPNLAIYFPSNMGSPCDVEIIGNFINVTGLATSAYNTGLVSGIEVQTGDVVIEDNTIYTYNIGDYAEGNYIYGISYAQSGAEPEFEITNNTIYTEGHYAISIKSTDDAVITDNYLVSTDLMGDDSVYIGSGTGNVVKDNLPAKELANVSVVADPVWIGSDATVTVTVPNATGTVTIEVNGKSYEVELVDGVAVKEIPAEDLMNGENVLNVTYDGPEFDTTSATAVLFVADGVVTQDTYLYYFNQEDNGKLFDYISEGATLDFQGSIINPDTNIVVQMNVNKPVNIISTTKDAYVDLNTTAGSLLGESPGNSFAVTNGGSGTNVTGIYFHNTQVWIANTHNVVLDNISVVVEDQRVGSGVGATSIRENSSNVILKNSYLYTRNNGGSTTFTMSWTTNCTIDNCTVKAEGNVGNLIYLNIFNVPGAPSGVPLNNYNKVTNNRIYGKEGSGISVGLMVEGQYNLIENNTLYKSSISTSFGGTNPYNNTYIGNTMTEGSGLTAQAGSIIHDNNVTGALSTGKESVAYNNIVGKAITVGASAVAYNNTAASATISGADSFAYDNTIATTATIGGKNAVVENNTFGGAVTISGAGVTFIGNNVNNTVTVNSNDNVIKANNINTTGTYAVDLKTKTGNNVTDNLLIASELKGDSAVNSASETNIVENNYPVTSDLAITVEDITYGEDAIVNVEFNPKATGTIVVSIDGTEYTVNITSEGQGSAIIPGLAAKDYEATATFTPDSAYSLDSDANASFTVSKANATMEAAADSVKVGDDVIVNVTFDKEDVTGDVSITIDGTEYSATIADGAATIVIPDLVAGEYAADVIYAGDENYNDAVASVSFAVDKYAVDFSKAKGHPGRVDQNATVDVILSESDATGTVYITVNGTDYSAELVDGAAVIYAPLLPAGTYNFDVIYSGDDKYENNTAPITFNVNKYYPTMKATADDVQVDESAIVNVVLPSDATGTVTITVDGVDYTGDVVDGTATVELPVISEAGTQALTVSYSGDDKYRVQTTTAKFDVNKYNATIKATARTVKLGNNVTVNVVLPSDATGEASITINDTVYTGTVEDGAAAIIIPDLGVGSYALTVEYSGDGKYNPANTTVTFNVNKQTTSMKATARTVKIGDNVTVNVALASDATGEVSIDVNGTVYTAEVVDGAASIVIPDLPYGQYAFDVVYSGDDKYKTRTATVTFNVNKQTTTMKATARTVKVGDDVTVNVALASDATGEVVITVDGVDYTATVVDGAASIVLPNLPAGQYSLEVKYSGDDKYKNRSSTVTFNVNKYNVKMKATAKYYSDGDYSIVSVALSDDATGSVSVGVNGKNYVANVVDGSALIAVPNLPAGDYTVDVAYSGDDKYKNYTATTTLKVNK